MRFLQAQVWPQLEAQAIPTKSEIEDLLGWLQFCSGSHVQSAC